jgi:hypothetical protein
VAVSGINNINNGENISRKHRETGSEKWRKMASAAPQLAASKNNGGGHGGGEKRALAATCLASAKTAAMAAYQSMTKMA